MMILYENHLNKLEWCIDIGKRISADCIRIFPFRIEKEKVPTERFSLYLTLQTNSPNQCKLRKIIPLVIENCPFSYLLWYNDFHLTSTIKTIT